MNSILKRYTIVLLLLIHLIGSTLILFLFDGTGERGSADSVLHYLFSKDAVNTPSQFFNHWAKPLFVLLSFPFAQFGIIGIKVFNIILASLTILYTYKTVSALKYKNPFIAPIVLIFTPLYFVLTFSGLTEILFSFLIIYSTYLFIKNKYILGAIIISFLPFARSEGLIIIGVFGFFLLLKKEWKIIPYLILGHLVYSFAGYFYYDDILWVFTKIPYAKMSSTYENGNLFHFVHQLFYVIGAPIYLLLIAGITALIKKYINDRTSLFNEVSVLIFGGFLSFFVSHSLFWYLGIFNSMGLKRVLIAVAPFIAIIALMGYNFLTNFSFKNNTYLKRGIQFSLVLIVIVFPFTSNKSAIHWEKDFKLVKNQELAIEVINYIENINSEKTYIYSYPYFSDLLKINHSDKSIRVNLSNDNLKNIKENDIVIWDSWICAIENGISEKNIREIPYLKELKTFRIQDENGEYSFIVFSKK